MNLTPKQKQVFEFIKKFFQDKGYAPSKQEIADYFGFKSRGTVSDYLKRLKDLGLLNGDGTARSLRISHAGNQLPLLGKVAAGFPLQHFKHDEFLEVPSQFLKPGKQHYCLQVEGESMKDEAILDGDYVIIRDQSLVQNGQIVVASINGESTLKRFYKKYNKIELHPANHKFDTITVKAPMEFQIQGILVGVLRPLD